MELSINYDFTPDMDIIPPGSLPEPTLASTVHEIGSQSFFDISPIQKPVLDLTQIIRRSMPATVFIGTTKSAKTIWDESLFQEGEKIS